MAVDFARLSSTNGHIVELSDVRDSGLDGGAVGALASRRTAAALLLVLHGMQQQQQQQQWPQEMLHFLQQ